VTRLGRSDRSHLLARRNVISSADVLEGRMRIRALLAVLLVVVAGCTGTLAEVHSSPAVIPAPVLVPVGYVHGNTTEVPITYPVGAGPITRDVTVYVWVSGYSRTVETDTGNHTAGLLVVSSPNERVAGQSVNPFVHLSNRELVAELFDLVVEAGAATGQNVTEVADLRETGVDERIVLGEQVEVVTYTATVRYEPAATSNATDGRATASNSVDGTRKLVIHLMAVEHGDDVVLALGVHGDAMDEGETMAGLMEAIEHEADGAAD
jgi:hypothetical protein